jgi:cobalt-zinc-cadmium efflux system outer membrane protein
VELGGKRSLRREQADAERGLAEQHLAARERELVREIRGTFALGLWLQARLVLLRQNIGILGKVAEAARRRKEAGGGSVAEELKLRLQLSQARLEAEHAAGELEAVRTRLAWLMGEAPPRFTVLQGDLTQRDPLPGWDAVVRNVERHPDLARGRIERDLRVLALKSARAQNVPDLDFNAGVRRLNAGGGDWGLVGGVSVPFPLWNRNRGDIKGADLRLQGADRETEAVRRELLSRARALWSGLRIKGLEIDQLRTELLPEAEAAREASHAAYGAGRFGAVDLMDGQRTWLELNEQYIGALGAYHRDMAELGTLAGDENTLDAKGTP